MKVRYSPSTQERMKSTIILIALALLPEIAGAGSPRPIGTVATRTFPYSMVGQLTFFAGSAAFLGTGTVVQPFGVLTAAHNLYDPTDGWSTDILFKRAHYNDTELSSRYASRAYILGGYQANAFTYGGDDVRTFARDIGGLTFRTRPAAGDYLGWTTNVRLLTGSTPRALLGYGADLHNGEQLLAVGAMPFHPVYGAFFESDNTLIEAGMSGGPVIATLPDGSRYICGVIVSGSDFPLSAGVRVVNSGTSDFILKYLSAQAPP